MRVMDHDSILFVTESGKLHAIRGFDIPEASRTSLGSPLADLIPGEGAHDLTSGGDAHDLIPGEVTATFSRVCLSVLRQAGGCEDHDVLDVSLDSSLRLPILAVIMPC